MSMQGVQNEEKIELDKEEQRAVRKRSMALLGSIIRPVRNRLWGSLFLVIGSQGLRVSMPFLMAVAIDTALPAAVKGDLGPLWGISAAYLGAAVASSALIAFFVRYAARINQDIMFALRGRLFRHTQKLSVQFHETYTSGRVISRQTNDLDSIMELLNSGGNEMIAGLLYARRFYDPMEQLAMFYNSFQSANSGLEKISGVLQEEPSVADPVEPVEFTDSKGHIEFEDVRFSYGDGKEVLHEFSLDIPAGQTIALVGTTGAGKSTLAKLVSRFYDPTTGTVRLDGVNLRDIRDEDLRNAIVMVTQEAYLFSGSVADNIALGKPDATIEEIRDAARAVGADEFIMALPDGYDTDVNKRGGRVSAGQRQLISFARAFIASPRVLILDEATASLDIPSERLVQHGLKTLLAGRTAIIIAHRLSTVSIADRVLVMEHGRIIEDDAPAKLIAGTGKFAKMHKAWRDSLV
jgi:ABC-type multidrug transport system fused ATPase/permease subunit